MIFHVCVIIVPVSVAPKHLLSLKYIMGLIFPAITSLLKVSQLSSLELLLTFPFVTKKKH